MRNLDGRHVERGRQVDDEPVDLLVLQGLDRAGVRREDRWLLRRLDLALDQLVARRAQLRAELVGLEPRHRRHLRDRSPVVDDDRLRHVVVRIAEVDDLRPVRRERDLVDVEVERLLARGERVVERRVLPGDVAMGETQLLRQGVGDSGLVALPAVGIADLPATALPHEGDDLRPP